ncbi:MAG: molybdenum cofactor guanylyltransferase [Bacteroidota bacterium]|nr:molybdenum cofactor guanylyltransferase [Bacteroidota bacterium]
MHNKKGQNQTVHQQASSINGLVLCGGKSKRMGTDKGSLHYHNKSQREHVFDLLSSFCNEVFLSVNEHQSGSVQNLPYIQDTMVDKGPVSGILSAFEHNRNVAWLVVACDLPYLNKETIDYLLQHRNPQKTATAFWNEEGELPEPLIAIWEPKAFLFLHQFVLDGFHCPRKFLLHSDVEMLTAPDASLFKNINTKQEYENTMKTLQKQSEISV